MQTIVGYVRPQLNLSQPFNQAAHVLEHLMLSNKTRRQLFKDASWINGYTSELYMALYAVTDRPLSLSGLAPDYTTLSEARKTIAQEAAEKDKKAVEAKLEALYTKDSPARRQKVFSPSRHTEAQLRAILSKQFGYEIKLSYDKYEIYFYNVAMDSPVFIQTFETEKNTLNQGVKRIGKSGRVELIIPLEVDNTNYASVEAWCFAMGDSDGGELYAFMREQGLVYWVDVYYNPYHRAIVISFDSQKPKKALEAVHNFLRTFVFKSVDEKILFSQYQRELRLLWQNPRVNALYLLEEAIVGGITIAPAKRRYKRGIINELSVTITGNLNQSLVIHS